MLVSLIPIRHSAGLTAPRSLALAWLAALEHLVPMRRAPAGHLGLGRATKDPVARSLPGVQRTGTRYISEQSRLDLP